jgi:DNA-binding NtrC family response regulator
VRLPIAIARAKSLLNQHEKKRFLVIDDDQQVLKHIESMLTQWHYDVMCVSGIQHAMNIIEQDWHCVISDWNLGDGCGDEILKYTGQHNMPSILMSSHRTDNLIALAKTYNSHFLRKPLSPSRLRAKLMAAISDSSRGQH